MLSFLIKSFIKAVVTLFVVVTVVFLPHGSQAMPSISSPVMDSTPRVVPN